MPKPIGHFVGYKSFAVDPNWVKTQKKIRELKEQKRFAEWSKKWITVTRLKKERLWTDGAIERFLGKPKKQGKYKVFAVDDVRRAERRKAFKEWLLPRIEKKLATDEYFQIKKI
ncbi:hypothetical protein P3746_20495 [Vibrio parahaemolyticus]|uniref:hypothetical protein n=1 Tax=Vibrio vulnificus TaxID=672 RepID=UPI000D732920|nr:hypothetical protein [Vibrio vulnificus]MDF5600799.1 hypothetical protein [Vibrio parahaemolyticus]PWY32238.1 hypothetical protein VV86_17210 [Vibrio vulnificus]